MSTLITHLSQLLFESKVLAEVYAKLTAGQDATIGIPLSARSFFVAATFAAQKGGHREAEDREAEQQPLLVVMAGEQAAHLFAHELAAWLPAGSVLRFPERLDRPWSENPLTNEDIYRVGQRARALHALASGEPCIVVASARSLLRELPPKPQSFAPLHFATGSTLAPVSYEELPNWLTQRGYTRLDACDGAGTFSIRGDVLDLHPSNLTYPVRIEFFGEEVECIRRIVPATGQSIGMLDSLDVYAVCELIYDTEAAKHAEYVIHTLEGTAATELPKNVKQHLEFFKQGVSFRLAERYLPYLFSQSATVLDYLSSAALITLIEPRSLFDDVVRAYDEISSSAELARVNPEGLYRAPASLDFGKQQRLTLLSLLTEGTLLDARLEVKHLEIGQSHEKLASAAQMLLAGGFAAVLGISERRAREEVLLALSDAHVSFSAWNNNDFCEIASGKQVSTSVLTVSEKDIPASFSLPQAKIALLGLGTTSAQRAARRGRTGGTRGGTAASVMEGATGNVMEGAAGSAANGSTNASANGSAGTTTTAAGHTANSERVLDPTALTFPYQPGDYVVHETHGIALFKKLVRREIAGIERDYLHLEYAKGDKLFTPVEQIDRITRYVGPESKAPRLTRLNTSDWARATKKARKAAKELAFDLVDLYARRGAVQGFAFASDDEVQREMESLFPYEETSDQLAAIADVKADMEQAKPMDRLICGDVGFGKTEVALRAAFKAAQNGKQVMLLCPTTILAQQHYTTFSERFEQFVVEVDVLSRFRTAAEQRKILERFAKGALDVLVGTHRLLSADVNPRDLGLIIIDEEQRFGVQHKEQLKNLREQVDVLTLTATPIPRTMSMAMSGVRDLSRIDTPPRSRTPVKVHVGEWDEDVVSAAIRREMERGGQVYYVSNRVKDLDDATARVAAVAPEARVVVAHGKMSGTQLEAAMERFAANEYDVLIATTIIESGLDNPHTNTLIIEDSQRLGLAQLYQLKGRVGRSHAQAFSYFLFPSQSSLTPEAIERLTAIDEFQDLGSGTKIAMRDLEIRGAGSLLGAEQHGMLSAVGFDLFAAMLHEAIESDALDGDAAEGEATPSQEVRIDLPIPFFLPEEYVPAVDERVLLYRRIAAASNLPTLEALSKQLEENYGALPQPARNLLDRERAKLLAEKLGISHIARIRGKLNLEPLALSKEQSAWAKEQSGTYFPQSHKLLFPVDESEGTLTTLVGLLETLLDVL
ncbi:MAG: transcription-repair coupling factor [Coriobacteriia bacterium]|nr:transcription-repair coupling factor [Coriobacteriia bacterium]